MKPFGRFENKKHNEGMVKQVLERCEKATPKVAERVRSVYIPDIERISPSIRQGFDYLENDLIALIRDPKGPIGGGEYDNWTQEEMAELYTVIFGKDVPTQWIGKSKGADKE